MTPGRAGRILALIVLLAGCSKPPSEKDILGSIISWIGTGDIAAQAWLNHTTFDRYTRETLELSSKKLDDQAEQLKDVAPAHSASLDSAVSSARHSMTDIAHLVAANDAPDIAAKLDSLRAASRVVLAIADSIGKQR